MCGSKKKPTQLIMKKTKSSNWPTLVPSFFPFGFARLVFFTHKKTSVTKNIKGKIKGKFHKEK